MSRSNRVRFCDRCGYNWQPSTRKRPPRCPRCKSQYWDLPRSYQINQNTPPKKSEERFHQRLSSSFGFASPGTILIFFAIIIMFLVMVWFLVQPPSCSEESQVQLIGVLKGFERNETNWDVRINNKTYFFNYFDQGYMEKMIGENVTILCCLRTSDYRPYFVYSMLSCYINDNLEK